MQAQARIKHGKIHVQASTQSVNRSYGVAADLNVTDELKAWIDDQPHPKSSLAGSSARYVPVEITRSQDGDGLVASINGSGEGFNKPQGALFSIHGCGALEEAVRQEDGFSTTHSDKGEISYTVQKEVSTQ